MPDFSKTLRGSCHCQSVSWLFRAIPDSVTACNCTVCRRYGVLWAYDYENEGISVEGSTTAYVRDGAGQGSIGFHFCPRCGCVAYWRSQRADDQGRRRIAVNMRLTEPDAIAHLPVDHFDGLDSWEDLPRDSRCIRDLWF